MRVRLQRAHLAGARYDASYISVWPHDSCALQLPLHLLVVCCCCCCPVPTCASTGHSRLCPSSPSSDATPSVKATHSRSAEACLRLISSQLRKKEKNEENLAIGPFYLLLALLCPLPLPPKGAAPDAMGVCGSRELRKETLHEQQAQAGTGRPSPQTKSGATRRSLAFVSSAGVRIRLPCSRAHVQEDVLQLTCKRSEGEQSGRERVSAEA